MGIVYFPFLIAAAIGITVVLFGTLKKKWVRDKGKLKHISTQKTVVCILVVIAPLQFFAVIAQWILGYFFSTWIYAGLAAGVTLMAFIINIVFQMNFGKKFNSRDLPADKFKMLKNKEITPE